MNDYGELYKQWLEYQKQALIKEKVSINDMPLNDIGICYFEYFKIRTLEAKKYNTFMSTEIKNNPLFSQYQNVILEIERKAKQGETLISYFSKGIKRIKKPDPMLNEWGIIHCHLSNEMQSNGFVKRTKFLLFLFRDINNDNNLYFLNIYPHQKWENIQALKVLNNNWKNALDTYKLDRKLSDYTDISEEDILLLRENNINTEVILSSNDIYLPLGGGQSGNGLNIESSMLDTTYRREFLIYEQSLINAYNIDKKQLKLLIINKQALVTFNQKNVLLRLPRKVIPIHWIQIYSSYNYNNGNIISE